MSRPETFSHIKFVTLYFRNRFSRLPKSASRTHFYSLSPSHRHIKNPKQIPRNSKKQQQKKKMKASPRVQKPLSDCSNTVNVNVNVIVNAAASPQSSTASTATLKRQNPKLSDVTNTLLASLTGPKKNDAVSPDPKGSAPPRPFVASSPSTPRVSSSVSGTSDFGVPEPSSVYGRRQTAQKGKSRGKENEVPFGSPPTRVTRNSGKKTKQDGNNSQFEMDTTPIASTPCPRTSSLLSDTTKHEIFEPHSVYIRRQNEPRRKCKGKENIGASSCPPALKIQHTCDNSKEDGENSLSKRSKAPSRKKQRVVSLEKVSSKNTYIDEFLAQKKAYFDDLDKDELAVEEAEPGELE